MSAAVPSRPCHAGTSPALPGALASSVLRGPFEGTLAWQGQVPDWLQGCLIRTGAAVFELGDWAAGHWADGLGMLLRFEFKAGAPVRWQQRLLDCEFTRQVQQGGSPLACFGTVGQRSWLDRLRHPVPQTTDNANVHIRPAGRHWVAMTETDRHLLINPLSLRTEGELHFDDALPRRLYMGAHPHHDRKAAELINIGLAYGRRSQLIVFRQRDGSRLREEIGRVPLRAVPYVHSFAVTPGKVILVLPPLELEPLGLLGSSRPVGEHFRWRPSQGTRIVLMDRQTGAWTLQETDPLFMFHTVNAYESADHGVTLDLLGYPDATILSEGMRMEAIRSGGLPAVTSHLLRVRLRPGRSTCSVESPAPHAALEFPAIHQARVSGRQHGQVWGSDLSRVVKIDTRQGQCDYGAVLGLTIGEPVFVGRPGARDEDDGVLLTVASSATHGHGELILWDARTLEVMARGGVAAAIPLGFHGSFLAA